MSTPEREMLAALLAASDAVAAGLHEARDLIGKPPASSIEMVGFDLIKRTAARAFLKAFEQLEDVVAKVIRVVLVIENEDLAGLSARGVADKAEGIGVIGSADRWSAIVRLRNQLVHEYPLTPDEQYARLMEVWNAHTALLAVSASIHEYLRDHDYPEADHD